MAKALVHPPPLPGPQYKLHHGGAHLWNLRISAILTLRVYALFNCNRVILGLLSLGGLGFLAIGAYHRLSPAGRTLLQICSSLHHEGISEEMFEKAAIAHKDLDNADPDLQNEVARILAELGKQDTHWDSFVFHEAAGELESYSLIERNTQDDSYFVHPLVQHWSGSTLGAGRNPMRKCATTVIWLSVSWGFQDEDFKYVPSQAFATYHEEHGFTGCEGDLPRHHYSDGTCVCRKQVLGEEHLDTLASKAGLVAPLRNLGRWTEAEALEMLVMDTRKRVLGEEHPSTLASMANLVATLRNLGR
ncbi:hypothetical protein B0H14DRAFT_3554352 [Mycena olivaceomarginata]|nr:hypothetical protein B0H14DRAFT_3554352 [Mycena olivaceomarginata]